MSLPVKNPNNASLPIDITEVFAQVRLKAWNSAAQPVKLLAEDDGTIRQQLVLFDDVGAVQVRWNAELDGEARVSLVGLDVGSVIQNWLVESTGDCMPAPSVLTVVVLESYPVDEGIG